MKLWWLPGLVTCCTRIFLASLPTLVRLFNQFFKLSYESGFSLSSCNRVPSQRLINLLFKTLIQFLTRAFIERFTRLCLLFGKRFNASITSIPSSSRSFLCLVQMKNSNRSHTCTHEHRFYATGQETSLFQTQTLISVYNVQHSVPGDSLQRFLSLWNTWSVRPRNVCRSKEIPIYMHAVTTFFAHPPTSDYLLLFWNTFLRTRLSRVRTYVRTYDKRSSVLQIFVARKKRRTIQEFWYFLRCWTFFLQDGRTTSNYRRYLIWR